MTMTAEIALTQGQVAIVDAADFEWLSQWKWHAVRNDLRHPPSADSITRRLAAIDAVLAKATGDA